MAFVAGCSGGPEFNAADVVFAREMIPHQAEAVDVASLVEERGSRPEVVELANQIGATQDPEIQIMSGWLEEWGREVPNPDDEIHDSQVLGVGMTDDQMAELRTATGDTFDQIFLDMMIRHHESAIIMSETQLADGVDEDVRALAQEIIVGQQADIDHMRELLG